MSNERIPVLAEEVVRGSLLNAAAFKNAFLKQAIRLHTHYGSYYTYSTWEN